MRRLPVALVLACAIACSKSPPSSEHKVAMAAYETVMTRTLDPSYADPAFDDVTALLLAVPASAAEHASAQKLAHEIAAGRAKHAAMQAEFDASKKVKAVAASRAEIKVVAAPIAVALPTSDRESPTAVPTSPAARTQRRPTGPIVLYTTAWCGYCKRAKSFLNDRGVPFIEKDIEANSEAARECAAKRSANNLREGVPMIDVDGSFQVGFAPESLDWMLKKQGFL